MLNPWNPDGTFMAQKIALFSPISVFKGLTNWLQENLGRATPVHLIEEAINDQPFIIQFTGWKKMDE